MINGLITCSKFPLPDAARNIIVNVIVWYYIITIYFHVLLIEFYLLINLIDAATDIIITSPYRIFLNLASNLMSNVLSINELNARCINSQMFLFCFFFLEIRWTWFLQFTCVRRVTLFYEFFSSRQTLLYHSFDTLRWILFSWKLRAIAGMQRLLPFSLVLKECRECRELLFVPIKLDTIGGKCISRTRSVPSFWNLLVQKARFNGRSEIHCYY